MSEDFKSVTIKGAEIKPAQWHIDNAVIEHTSTHADIVSQWTHNYLSTINQKIAEYHEEYGELPERMFVIYNPEGHAVALAGAMRSFGSVIMEPVASPTTPPDKIYLHIPKPVPVTGGTPTKVVDLKAARDRAALMGRHALVQPDMRRPKR